MSKSLPFKIQFTAFLWRGGVWWNSKCQADIAVRIQTCNSVKSYPVTLWWASAPRAKEWEVCVILGFCRKVENSTLLGYYAESSGNFLPVFQDNQNIGKKLPLLTA
jgi:hypothetical protein